MADEPMAQIPGIEWTDELRAWDRRLRWHPWFFNMYDEYDAYKRGEQMHHEVQRIRTTSPQHEEIYMWHAKRVAMPKL